MPKLQWDTTGNREFETGVSNVALYVMNSNGTYGTGVPWNGVTSVSERPSGAEPTKLYADNIKYLTMLSAEDFAATIEAYMYPDEWAACDGSEEPATGVYIGQQPRKRFGLVYRTEIGNDIDGNAHGYKIHIIWNAMASPSEKQYQTINDSPDAITFSWELNSDPTAITEHTMTGGASYKPISCMTIDSTKVNDDTKMTTLLDTLFGGTGETATATLPTPDGIIDLMD